jgi:hypothetical protein
MKSIANCISDFKAARQDMKKLQADIPKIVGSEAVKVIKANFRLQGYDSGSGVTPWKDRSAATNKQYDQRKGVKGSVYQSSNKLLKQSGVLFNVVKYQVQGKLVYVGVDLGLVPYAKKMNDGGPGKWGKNSTNTPARKYMPDDGEGPNVKMLKAAFKKIQSQRDRALKQFKK